MQKYNTECGEVEILLMGLVDGELDAAQEQKVHEHLSVCKSCAAKYRSFSELKRGTSEMKFKKLPEMYWDDYWEHIYNKIERGIGWIFFSIGAIILLTFAGYEALKSFFLDQTQPMILRFGVGALSIGFIIIAVSVIREKLMIRKVDIYRSVKR